MQVDPVVRFARRHDIVVVLEMHQFQWSPCTGGNGVPRWSCENGGYTHDAVGGFNAQHDFWQGALAPDGRTLLDHFDDVWRLVARWYRRDRVVTGFELLNEPLDIGAIPTFEAQTLHPAYRRWAAILRDERAEQMLVLEPPVTRNLGVPAMPEPLGPNALYAPHLYTETAGIPELKYDGNAATTNADYALAASEAGGYGAALWVGEYGGNTEAAGGFRDATALAIRHQLDAQDAHLAGGAVWAYFPTDNTFSLVDVAGNEKGTLVDEWSRPYAQQTAGSPLALHYDVDTRELTYTFAEDATRKIPDPTVLFVPFARHYPGGVVVETTAGDEARVDVARNRIVLRRDRANPLHTIVVRPQ
jgi:endoglycosylceramidase